MSAKYNLAAQLFWNRQLGIQNGQIHQICQVGPNLVESNQNSNSSSSFPQHAPQLSNAEKDVQWLNPFVVEFGKYLFLGVNCVDINMSCFYDYRTSCWSAPWSRTKTCFWKRWIQRDYAGTVANIFLRFFSQGVHVHWSDKFTSGDQFVFLKLYKRYSYLLYLTKWPTDQTSKLTKSSGFNNRKSLFISKFIYVS